MAEAIVTTLLNTGVWVAEEVRLPWEAVRLRERSGQATSKGKGGKGRLVPLNAVGREALDALQPDPTLGPAAGPGFQGKRGPYTDRGIRTLRAVLGRRAGVPDVHPHRFRHDAARRLIAQVDLPPVAALLGYSRLDTVRLYTPPDQAARSSAATVLENS
jgi:site-specific recombinase XerD